MMKWKDQIIESVKATKYNIGFVDEPLRSVIDGVPIHIHWLKHSYTDRWFADPFILDFNDEEIIVLVEEWYDPILRGRISRLVVDRKTYELKSLKVVLDEGTHLSFPAIERVGRDVYIHPENSVIGKLENYKYNEKEDRFEKVGLLCNQPLTDSAIIEWQGKRMMFSTKLPDANGKELGIYQWDEKKHLFELKENYYFTDNISRMAGNIFQLDGKWYRPAQVCIKSYGDAVSLQEIVCDNGQWSFHEVRRIYSPHPDFELGFHTFNVCHDMIVVDALGYRKPRLAHLIKNIRKPFKKLK